MNELKIAKSLINHYNSAKKKNKSLISIAIKTSDDELKECNLENLKYILKTNGFNAKIEILENKEYFVYLPI